MSNTPEITVVEAAYIDSLPTEQQVDDVRHMSEPANTASEVECQRVQENFVSNGLSDGIEDLESADPALFTWASKGPNDTSKFSEGYYDCTGVCVVGTRQEIPGTELSFMTHQSPEKVLKNQEQFTRWLTGLCMELRDSVDASTVRSEIFAGRDGVSNMIKRILYDKKIHEDPDRLTERVENMVEYPEVRAEVIRRAKEGDEHYLQPYFDKMLDEYNEVIEIIAGVIEKIFNFRPVSTSGPNREVLGGTNAYFHTQKRTLYIIRRPQSHAANST